MSLTVGERTQTVRDLQARVVERRLAGTGDQDLRGWRATTAGSSGSRSVLVLAAHPWAGASTVAVALADAIVGEIGSPVHLVDAAPPESSGLVCASDRELGIGPDGWRLGRRGEIEIRRAAGNVQSPSDVPHIVSTGPAVMIVDAGWAPVGLVVTCGWPATLLDTADLVLVCRATIPGARRAEVALNRIDRADVVLAMVGARRLPGAVLASGGPRLRQAYDGGRVVCLPYDKRLDLEGVDDSPMPKAVAAAAAALSRLVWSERTTSHRTRRGVPR